MCVVCVVWRVCDCVASVVCVSGVVSVVGVVDGVWYGVGVCGVVWRCVWRVVCCV